MTRKPDEAQMQRLAMRARGAPLSTPMDPLREEPQHHWYEDKYRREIALDAPPETVRSCVEQVLRGCEFFPGWMVARRIDDLVIVGARLLGVWGLFADRIIEEHYDGGAEQFDLGFTYATVKGHFETGIESFWATRSGASAPLVFEIRAVSRSDNPIKRAISEVWVRSLQRRFGHDTPIHFEAALRSRLSRG